MLTKILTIFLVFLTTITAPTPAISALFFLPETETAPIAVEHESEEHAKLHRKKKNAAIPHPGEPYILEVSRYGSPPLSITLYTPRNIFKNLPLPPLRLLI